MFFDTHNHSQFSFDGEGTTVEKSALAAVEKGFGGICFTDHCDFYVPKMKEEFVRFWLLRFRKLDMTQPEQRQALVDTFINAIYLYDDKVLITFNYKEGTETVAFGEAVKAEKSSDMSARGAPRTAAQVLCSSPFYLFYRIHLAKAAQCLIIETVPRCARVRLGCIG